MLLLFINQQAAAAAGPGILTHDQDAGLKLLLNLKIVKFHLKYQLIDSLISVKLFK